MIINAEKLKIIVIQQCICGVNAPLLFLEVRFFFELLVFGA